MKEVAERYDNFFETLIKSAAKNGFEFVDDCGHISIREKNDTSGNYVRIDDVLSGKNLIAARLFY